MSSFGDTRVEILIKSVVIACFQQFVYREKSLLNENFLLISTDQFLNYGNRTDDLKIETLPAIGNCRLTS